MRMEHFGTRMPPTRGVATIFGTRSKQSERPLLTEIMKFKRIAIIYRICLYLAP